MKKLVLSVFTLAAVLYLAVSPALAAANCCCNGQSCCGQACCHPKK